ncbi:hypothetical protein INR49_025848 [Caranx melampygus]|nr:hypothetical protein INR49_025848 [Caranx melampygus]
MNLSVYFSKDTGNSIQEQTSSESGLKRTGLAELTAQHRLWTALLKTATKKSTSSFVMHMGGWTRKDSHVLDVLKDVSHRLWRQWVSAGLWVMEKRKEREKSLRMAVAYTNSSHTGKQIQVSSPIHIPQPLHETLVEEHWFLIVGHIVFMVQVFKSQIEDTSYRDQFHLDSHVLDVLKDLIHCLRRQWVSAGLGMMEKRKFAGWAVGEQPMTSEQLQKGPSATSQGARARTEDVVTVYALHLAVVLLLAHLEAAFATATV